jgi:four helix bundle protein
LAQKIANRKPDVVVESYRDLKVWQRAIEMTLAIYRATTAFPKEEIFGLTSQMRRAAVSTASNIAEGYGRHTRGEYKQFLGMARGSNLEVQTQIFIASKLDYSTPTLLKEAESLSIEVEHMLNSLIAKL